MSKKSRTRNCEYPGCNKPFAVKKNHKTQKMCDFHERMAAKKKEWGNGYGKED